MATVPPVVVIVTAITEEQFRKQEAKRIEDWLTEDNQLIFHDWTCDKRTKEVAIEWNCDCFLNDIVQRIKKGE